MFHLETARKVRWPDLANENIGRQLNLNLRYTQIRRCLGQALKRKLSVVPLNFKFNCLLHFSHYLLRKVGSVSLFSLLAGLYSGAKELDHLAY